MCVCVASAACNLNPYTLGGDVDDAGGGDGTVADGRTDDGNNGGDGGGDDGGMPDACVGFVEICNQLDDDCDGVADNGFDLQNDSANCGSCGNRCYQPNTLGTCVAGGCQYSCRPGYVDTDNDPTNGCDYRCTPTGDEVCDFADNDCDNQVDEGLNLETDVMNCGSCGNQCLVLNATAECVDRVCGYTQCNDGFADVIAAIPGCEYRCPVDPPLAQEVCNAIDDDCDGAVDEQPIAGQGGQCTDSGFELIGETGSCAFGVLECRSGVETCIGYTRPVSETCNGADDDCDGDEDEDFAPFFDVDPRHCGGCTPCNLANAVNGCTGGTCTITACLPGYVDADNDDTTGCEYACIPSGPEVCDGFDNDCDRLFDMDDPDLDQPQNFCIDRGECSNIDPTCGENPCNGDVEWYCPYPETVELDQDCLLVPEETVCDNLDGDCDNRVDEAFPEKFNNVACVDTGVGLCQGNGHYVCNAAGDGVQCDITNPGAAPSSEICNGLDEDCNGVADNDAPNDTVLVVQGGTSFRVDAYEASRPDASAVSEGVLAHRSCSRPGVMPWRNVSWTDAAAACAAAGARLCTEAEWQLSCEGLAGSAYPYGDVYDPDACNGRDLDPVCSTGADDGAYLMPTGYPFGCPAPGASVCESEFGAFDMSGNLREWTSQPVGANAYRIRGGAYDNIDQGLTCDLSFIALAPASSFPNLGFRCCDNP